MPLFVTQTVVTQTAHDSEKLASYGQAMTHMPEVAGSS
jgi:hypothetical protein